MPPELPIYANRFDNPFLVNYAAYHYYRSLGWVVKGGIKFCVDLLLYKRGPVFHHAECVLIRLIGNKWTEETVQIRCRSDSGLRRPCGPRVIALQPPKRQHILLVMAQHNKPSQFTSPEGVPTFVKLRVIATETHSTSRL